ncbi:hypothetical protein PHSY_002866 [Pseudozyma hubeiensis SY62]|uniref:Uncharacterized protein n=1 Tax=Pseudozyma hubeiensis (strain SY62) TaxID=1305764 RepID=R9P1Z1_PSEHS|nr:hypothetical protein PHSY_002866 [Pseudozyma hubeiensis SY62]GAC95291.1 hypothetical protein PHSY_002866 [Pseudozyma hubeiensis SY62]
MESNAVLKARENLRRYRHVSTLQSRRGLRIVSQPNRTLNERANLPSVVLSLTTMLPRVALIFPFIRRTASGTKGQFGPGP